MVEGEEDEKAIAHVCCLAPSLRSPFFDKLDRRGTPYISSKNNRFLNLSLSAALVGLVNFLVSGNLVLIVPEIVIILLVILFMFYALSSTERDGAKAKEKVRNSYIREKKAAFSQILLPRIPASLGLN